MARNASTDPTRLLLSSRGGSRAALVEPRVFGGLTVEEVVEIMDVSTTTVERERRTAESWHDQELGRGGGTP